MYQTAKAATVLMNNATILRDAEVTNLKSDDVGGGGF